MKYFALLAVAVVVCVDASVLNTGSSQVSRSDDGHGNYAFAYKEDHASGGTTRQEKGGPGIQVGSYSLRDHDGRQRIVEYVADAHGFRANIKTNEPGVDPKEDPASVSINGGGHATLIAAPVAIAEPVVYGKGLGLGGYGGGYGRGLGGYAAPEYGLSGPSSYGVHINHVSAPHLVAAPLLGYGKGYGGW